MGFVVSGLTNYVETEKNVLIKDLVFGNRAGDTIVNLRKQLGVKTKDRLNYLDVDPAIQDGSACGFSANGSTVLSERDVVTAQMKVNLSWCDRDLLGKFAEYQVKINADKYPADMPFESYVIDEVIKATSKKMEALVWKGATSANSGTDLIDGFITLASHQDSASTVTVSIASGTSLYNAVKAVINAIPEAILDKAVVFLSPANYRSLIFELVEKNLYHFAPGAEIEDNDVYFPGTSVRIHKTAGLAGDNNHIYASAYENMVYACDMLGDEEKIRFIYDDADELFKFISRWNAGVATLFPDMVVLGTYATE